MARDVDCPTKGTDTFDGTGWARKFWLATALLVAMIFAPGINGSSFAEDTGARITGADKEPQNWLSTGRTYGETRYSPLKQIDDRNVQKLGLAWSYDLDTRRGQEGTPLAVDGVLYTTSAWSKVQAFDVASGKFLWQFDPKVPGETAIKACCDVVNRGAAYWNGKIYIGTLDGRLIAINAKTGRQVWSTMTVNPAQNYTITGAPRVVKGRVIIGNGGADLGGLRGYVTAYDAENGKKDWRFYTVPGQPGHPDGEVSDAALAKLAIKTWQGQWWTKQAGGGGGTAWDSIVYDPEADLLYIGVGNSGFWNKHYRAPGDGDNLFVGSILALRPETGEYVWHYQETPGDEWDYTSTQSMVLADIVFDGHPRKVLLHAPKNGYFYIIDRLTGKLLSAKPYVPVNWSNGIDMATGRPRINPEARYDQTGKVWIAQPSSLGGHNWQPMAYNPATGLVYIPIVELVGIFKSDPNFHPQKLGSNTGDDVSAMASVLTDKKKAKMFSSASGALLAWNPVTQKPAWRMPNPGIWNGGVLTTAGSLVLQGDSEGHLNIYSAKTGAKLWSFDGQNPILAAPISYAVNGKQYVSVAVGFGGAMSLFGGQAGWGKNGPWTNRSRILTFTLGGAAKLPPIQAVQAAPFNTAPQFANGATIAKGAALYENTCVYCHGNAAISAGVVPDLRRSFAIGDKALFYQIAGKGILKDQGMVSFASMYSPQDLEAIRAYLIDRAHQSRAAETAQAPRH